MSIGSDWGQGLTEESVRALLTAPISSPFDSAMDLFKKLFEGLGNLLGGALELGGEVLGAVAGGVEDLINGILDFIGNIFRRQTDREEKDLPPVYLHIPSLEDATQPLF
jgi:hypothetical protein